MYRAKCSALATSVSPDVDSIYRVGDAVYTALLVKEDKSPNHWLLSGYEVRSARTKSDPR